MKNLTLGAWGPSWKQSSSQHHQPADMVLPHDYLYDLYAVCNHHGGMHGGHYTGMDLGCISNTPHAAEVSSKGNENTHCSQIFVLPSLH